MSVRATRCTACGRVSVPPRPDCPSCMEASTEPVELGGEGTLYSFTEVHSAPAGFEAPYVLGVVELDAGGRVMGVVRCETIEVGMRVVVSADFSVTAAEA